ncbi:MAG TPA: DUF3748 domain-containing protein [Candidatus Hydrogenedentes bacterium]|nr:DUF3748 domain-containing protein [Candidatus Hydrogenedentota bacterium]HOH35764.1 DUF3748 domain-containing protein [Candidatus Hydrogenedentota bacterium]HQH69025.1 DUF3748 domain-containing protein [Candidatus Hydrogenedentota bacterium]HQM33506.1 DUF3748 domain-containing protein [Candidatus Hydrogenedentota bacterium]
MFIRVIVLAVLFVIGASLTPAYGAERQITTSAKNHNLDNNDNFSPDGRFLCYDTRETVGSGIGNGQTIEKVELATGEETMLYQPEKTLTGDNAAPGVGAVTFCPVANKVAFIHGPLVEDVAERGYYDKTNRVGAEVIADGSQRRVWLDRRDVATGRDTLPGAHRGGTHRHEYSFDGKRVGFTYDDALLTEYGRTIGMLAPHPQAPEGATHYFALLVRVAPKDTSRPGELESAKSDSWIGREGLMRGFIGTVREPDGSFQESLFVVDVPANVDVTTADSGAADRYPSPPTGVTWRRLTHTWAAGNVRGTLQGDRIAYYAKAADGARQVFIIPSDGSDQSDEPAKRPVQATHFPGGAGDGIRWHPSGNSIACIADGGVAVTCVVPGPNFGKSVFLTPHGDTERSDLVWSPDGSVLAYCRVVPTLGADGQPARNYKGEDFSQIFTVEFPDANHDGIADTLK